jgi:hypothetical protein
MVDHCEEAARGLQRRVEGPAGLQGPQGGIFHTSRGWTVAPAGEY